MQDMHSHASGFAPARFAMARTLMRVVSWAIGRAMRRVATVPNNGEGSNFFFSHFQRDVRLRTLTNLLLHII